MTTTTDLCILGTGMVGYQQLTDESRQVLDRATRAYVLHPLPEVHEYLDDSCEEVVDLSTAYEEGQNRGQSYEKMVERVLDGLTQSDGPVVMVTYGHPTVGVTPTKLLRDRAESEGHSVTVLPGISSLDCLYTDLEFNPLDRGMQLFEATDILLYDIELDPTTPTFILQIGMVGTRLYDDRESTPERFLPMKTHLSTFYPADHEVQFVRTATMPLADAEQITVQIDEMESVADEIGMSHTLYIPPARERTVHDERFESTVESGEYLDTITK